jgi:O-methyltransferase involved in polyketide biosynthesis
VIPSEEFIKTPMGVSPAIAEVKSPPLLETVAPLDAVTPPSIAVSPATAEVIPTITTPPETVTLSEVPPPLEASPAARDTTDQDLLGMGRTSGQRTAEVFAGLRAEMMPSVETDALARISGRIAARLMISLSSKKVLNFVPVRTASFAGLVKQALNGDGTGKVLVEIATGFSPRGLMLAQEMPNLQVIEIDLPDVIQEKRKRLEGKQISTPPNLTWKSADLGIQPLSEVLDQQRVDVVTAEGLMPYFDYPDITRIARHVYQSLKPGGVLIADLGYVSGQGLQEAGRIVQIFRRYTSTAPGAVHDEETAYDLFRNAGYEKVELYRMPQTAALFNLPQPVSDVLFFMVAQRKPE